MKEKPNLPPEPIVFDTQPSEITLHEGKYFWCACGRSKKHPFCDGSHYGTGIRPKRFVIEKEQKVWICNCKKTKTPPYCDGSHKTIK
jgi:CDGSH iron-sulfur domain-containing protein 3